MPVDKLSIEQFAMRIKDKYPQYKNIDDTVLANRMLEKYPVYRDRVNIPAPKPSAPSAVPSEQRGADFKPMTDWLNITSPVKNQPDAAPVPVNEHSVNTAESSKRINDHINNIDQSVSNLIYDYKKDMQGRAKSIQLGMNPKESMPINAQVAAAEKMAAQPVQVTKDEVDQYKSEMQQNGGMLRNALDQKVKDLSKTNPIESNRLKADIYRVDAKDRPDNEKQIAKNVDKIISGDVDYDPKRMILYTPHSNFFSGLALGYKQKKQAFEDYETWTKGSEASIISELNSRIKAQDPDDPVDLPVGKWAEGGMILGGQPLKPIVGGALATWLGTPLSGAAATSGISAHEMYKLAIGSGLPQNYAAIKRQNPAMPDYTAYTKAKDLTEKQATADAFTGAAMGFVGGETAFKPTNVVLTKAVKSSLKQIGQETAKKTFEGLGVGVIGGAGQIVKNIMAQKAGLPVSTTEGAGQQLMMGMGMTVGAAILAKSPKLLKPSTYTQLAHGLSKLPDHILNHEFNNLQEVGYINPDEMKQAHNAIRKQKEIDASIPKNISEPDRLKIANKIKERSDLENNVETQDAAYHPALKEKIKKINEEIVGISKRSDIQSLVHKETEAGNVHESAAELFRNATDQELGSHMADIAKLGHDPATEAHAIVAFGERIVNKAKELFPKESNVSMDVISDKEYNDFIDKGYVSSERLNNIAEKVKNRQKLSAKEMEIFTDKTTHINKIISQTMASEEGAGKLKPAEGEHLTASNIQEKIDEIEKMRQEEIDKINQSGDDEEHARDRFDARIKVHDKYDAAIEGLKKSKTLESGAGKVNPELVGNTEVSEHGEDDKTAKGQENGTEDSKLTQDGLKEAHELGEYLVEKKKNWIITSGVQRALETATEAAKKFKEITDKTIKVEVNKLLKTWDIGKYDGEPEGSFKEDEWTKKPGESPEGGESFNSFTDRMEKAYQFVKSLPEDYHVITHSKVMRAFDALKESGGKWTEETTNKFLKNKEHAVQEPSGETQIPRNAGEGGNLPGSSEGVRPSQQGEGLAGTSNTEEGSEGQSTKEKVGPYPGPLSELPFGEDIGIAHDYRVQRAFNQGEMPPIRGDVMTPEQYVMRGRRLISEGVDPQKVAADFKDSGKIGVDDISVVRAEYERLARETNKAANTYGVDSKQDKAARDAEEEWYDKTVKPMLTAWGAMGREAQGQTDIDTGTFTGMRRFFKQETGKEMSPQKAEHAKKLSEQVSKLTKEVEDLKSKLTSEIDNASSEKAKTTKEKAQALADKIRQWKIHKKGGGTYAATPLSLAWDAAVEVMARTLEASGSVFQAVADGMDHLRNSDWYKSLNEAEKANAEKEFKENFGNDIYTQFVDKKGNKFTAEEAKNVWDYAKEAYLNRGADFEQMVNGVAKDLGLSNDQVRYAITTPKGAKEITDAMYKKQYQQRMAINNAKNWVRSQNTPKLVKFIKFFPHLFFRLKTLGHGTVGFITHAGMNIFRPSAWGTYWPNFAKQFKLANPFGGEAHYEQAMRDLENDPTFAIWKRAGLAIDPNEQFDDYQTFDKLLGPLGKIGDRGFGALKLLRLDMANAELGRLSDVERADKDTIKQVAAIINHATGTSKIALPDATSTVFFAPRLEASRWARLVGQPAKAIATLTRWGSASVADKAAAKIVAKRSGEMIAMYTAALMANQGVLMATGSDKRVNLLHPGDPDWLKFKIGDKNVDVSGGMISAIGFVGHLIHISMEHEKELKGKSRRDEIAKTLYQYGRGKLSPFASTATDFATHHDYSGNTMPFSKDKPLTKFGHHLDWKEYILHEQTPIPVSEALKDMTDQMKERGMSDADINTIMGAIFVGTMSGFTGARITEAKQKHSSSPEGRGVAHSTR